MKQLLLIVAISLFFLEKSFSENVNIYEKIDLFGEVLEKINKEYVDEIDQSKSMDAAINGLLQSLDPYSAYMTPESFESMQTETSGKFGGLGIEVGMEAGVVKVISPIDNSPASKAGLKAGDYIVKINNIQVQGKSLMEAVDLMRGSVGSSIEITVRRRGIKNSKIEGKESLDWKLVDGIDLIVHIFNPEKRKFYELEKIWLELIPKEKITI